MHVNIFEWNTRTSTYTTTSRQLGMHNWSANWIIHGIFHVLGCIAVSAKELASLLVVVDVVRHGGHDWVMGRAIDMDLGCIG